MSYWHAFRFSKKLKISKNQDIFGYGLQAGVGIYNNGFDFQCTVQLFVQLMGIENSVGTLALRKQPWTSIF